MKRSREIILQATQRCNDTASRSSAVDVLSFARTSLYVVYLLAEGDHEGLKAWIGALRQKHYRALWDNNNAVGEAHADTKTNRRVDRAPFTHTHHCPPIPEEINTHNAPKHRFFIKRHPARA